MLLHVIETARGIYCAMDLCADSQWLRRKVKDASIFLVCNFRNGNVFAVDYQLADVMHLTAARRIKSSAVKHNSRSAIAFEGFDHTGVKVV